MGLPWHQRHIVALPVKSWSTLGAKEHPLLSSLSQQAGGGCNTGAQKQPADFFTQNLGKQLLVPCSEREGKARGLGGLMLVPGQR